MISKIKEHNFSFNEISVTILDKSLVVYRILVYIVLYFSRFALQDTFTVDWTADLTNDHTGGHTNADPI